MINHLDSCLVKGSRRKTTQLTLFSSMKRVTSPLTKESLTKGKGQTGKRNLDCTIVPLAEVSAIGVDSEELVCDNSKEGALCPLSNAGTENQEIMNGVVKAEIDVVDRSHSARDVKSEPFEMTQRDYVKFEELCICTCHFPAVNSCCEDTPESEQTVASRNSLLGANDDEASVHMHRIVREEVFRDSSVVIGDINTCIVGRKFSMEAVCEGMQLAFVRDADNPKDSNAVKGFVLTVPEDVF